MICRVISLDQKQRLMSISYTDHPNVKLHHRDMIIRMYVHS